MFRRALPVVLRIPPTELIPYKYTRYFSHLIGRRWSYPPTDAA